MRSARRTIASQPNPQQPSRRRDRPFKRSESGGNRYARYARFDLAWQSERKPFSSILNTSGIASVNSTQNVAGEVYCQNRAESVCGSAGAWILLEVVKVEQKARMRCVPRTEVQAAWTRAGSFGLRPTCRQTLHQRRQILGRAGLVIAARFAGSISQYP